MSYGDGEGNKHGAPCGAPCLSKAIPAGHRVQPQCQLGRTEGAPYKTKRQCPKGQHSGDLLPGTAQTAASGQEGVGGEGSGCRQDKNSDIRPQGMGSDDAGIGIVQHGDQTQANEYADCPHSRNAGVGSPPGTGLEESQ